MSSLVERLRVRPEKRPLYNVDNSSSSEEDDDNNEEFIAAKEAIDNKSERQTTRISRKNKVRIIFFIKFYPVKS